jgi:hypothetical protein
VVPRKLWGCWTLLFPCRKRVAQPRDCVGPRIVPGESAPTRTRTGNLRITRGYVKAGRWRSCRVIIWTGERLLSACGLGVASDRAEPVSAGFRVVTVS